MSLLLSQICSSGQDTRQLSSSNKATFHYSNATPTTWVVFMNSTSFARTSKTMRTQEDKKTWWEAVGYGNYTGS